MEILTFILSAVVLLTIYLIGKSVLTKDIKDLKIGFFKGFDLITQTQNIISSLVHFQ